MKPKRAGRGRVFRFASSASAWTLGAVASAAVFSATAAVTVGQVKPAGDGGGKPAAKGDAKPKGDKPKGDKPKAAAEPAAAPAATASGRPYPLAVPADPAVLTDAMIDESIRKGSDWLLKQFDPKTHLVATTKKEDETHRGGEQALAVYALMQSGLAIKDPRLDLKSPDLLNKVDALMKLDLDKGNPQSYAYGLRATALALFVSQIPDLGGKEKNELQLKRAAAQQRLQADAAWCVLATRDGSYHYRKGKGTFKDVQELDAYYRKIDPARIPVAKAAYDNSTSQYGLLGAWSAAEAGIEIPTPYWYLVAHHWMKKQLGNGQWAYNDAKGERGGTANMTAAGLASMLVTHEYVEPAQMGGSVGREPYNAPIKKALNWFEQGNNGVGAGGGYGHYGIERVGLASGFKFFGQNDWYRVVARRIIDAQKKGKDGSWAGGNGPVVETSYHLLFLSRGRHPVLMNKLRFDGDAKNPGYWSNRPRDAANLAAAMSKKLEQQLNWQVISVRTPWQEWLDSPILTIASHQPYTFSADELDRVRRFVEAGGILYTQADGSAPAFDKFAYELCKDLFKRELVEVPSNHPLFTTESVFKIIPPVPLKMATNGSRVLMLHSNVDLAKTWQARDTSPKARPHFELAVNLFVYGSGKLGYRNRLESLFVPDPKTPPAATYGVARLSYPAASHPTDWDPEPGAWRRFPAVVWHQTGYKLAPAEVKMDALKPVDPAKKPTDPSNVRFAHLTGTAKQPWKSEQVKAVRAFVASGGVLLVDVTGGANGFEESAKDLLAQAFPDAPAADLPPTHPVLAGGQPGMEDLTRRVLRPLVTEKSGRNHGPLRIVRSGRGTVIFSPLDVTSGLLGTNTGGIVGYESAYAQKLVKNLVIWAADGAKPEAPSPAEAGPAEAGADDGKPAAAAPAAPAPAAK